MLKRDDYVRAKHEGVFSKWQGLARFMLPWKPFQETADLRKTLPDYSFSRDLGPKVLIGANGWEDSRKLKDGVSRFGVKGSFPGLYEAVIGQDQNSLAHQDTENIRSRLRSSVHHKKLGHGEFMSQRKSGLSQTILPLTQKEISIGTEEKKGVFEEENSCDAAEEKSSFLASILRVTRSRPQSVSERHDEIVDETESDSVCGVLLEDGTTCPTVPVNGRKRCTEHKGQRISRKHIPSEVHAETENICGVILPDMVPCRTKPVSRRQRCEEHKGMRVNAFFFLLNPTERSKTVKEDISKPEACRGSLNQEDLVPSLFCEATTNNGLRCTRSAATGSRRCWQHKEKTLEKRSSESKTVNQVICGIKLHNGSVCEKSPAKGRKRCEEHKGMRIIT